MRNMTSHGYAWPDMVVSGIRVMVTVITKRDRDVDHHQVVIDHSISQSDCSINTNRNSRHCCVRGRRAADRRDQEEQVADYRRHEAVAKNSRFIYSSDLSWHASTYHR